MSKRYMDWADWAGDHYEEVEAKAGCGGNCVHEEVSASGYCLDCGIAVEGWEPDDAQILTQTGTKVPA